MIEWWGWLLIWAGLVLLLLGVVALLAWRLVRRFLALLGDFFALSEKSAILDGVSAESAARPLNAILERHEVVRSRFEQRMQRRRDRKHSRRQARIERAKIITTVDINSLDTNPKE